MTASSSWTAECSPFTSATKRSGPPAKWDQVTADPDHVAGLNTPYVDDDEDEDFDDVYDDYGDEESEDEVDENDAAGGD